MKRYIVAFYTCFSPRSYKKLQINSIIAILCCFVFSPLTAQTTDTLISKRRQEHIMSKRMPRSINTTKPSGSIAINRDERYKSMTLGDLVREVFVKTGTCVMVDNVTSRIYGWDEVTQTWGTLRGLAYFNKADSDFPLEEGLILSTGDVRAVEGPNNDEGGLSGGSPYTGDADLQAILTKQGTTVTNVGILEFDFVPTGTSMEFTYVFASEEYPEYVNSPYNDVFGFFVNKVGSSTKSNIALLPDTDNPGIYEVSINNVNSGCWVDYKYATQTGATYSPTPHNEKYFTPNPYKSLGTEFDGYTVVLTAKYTGLEPCQKYHLKLAIGNAGDTGWGSGVFLGAKSFDAGNKVVVYGNSIEGVEHIFKNCDQNYIRVTRSETSDQAVTVELGYSGTANNGMHYTQLNGTPLPTSVTIPANQTYVDIWFKATPLAVPGSYFDVVLYCPCVGMSVAATKRVNIYDFSAFVSAISTSACSSGNNGTITVSSSGGSGIYEYSINNGTTWQTSTLFSGLAPGTYTVLARDVGSCQTPLSKVVTIGSTIADAGGDVTQCNNATFTMNGSLPKAGETGTWSVVGTNPGLTITNPLLYNTTVTMSANKTATLRWTISNGICTSYDDVVIKNNSMPTATTSVLHVTCYDGNNGSIIVSASGGSGIGYQYSKDNGNNWQSSPTFTNLPADNYIVLVKDNTQCTSLPQNITISQPLALLLSSDLSTSVTCPNINAHITVNNSKNGVTYNVYNAPIAGTLVAGQVGNGASLNLTMGTLGATTTFYVEATDGTCTSARFAVTIPIRETLLVYPDIRIWACPQNTINLSKYIDILDFVSVKWTTTPSNTIAVNNDGIIGNASQLQQGHVYTYFYEIQNSCSLVQNGTLYLAVPKDYLLESNRGELKICYENATAIQLNQIFGVDADGTWSCTPLAANSHLLVSTTTPHTGAAIFNGKAAWGNNTIPFDGNGNKVITITYTPAPGSCFAGNIYTITIILTDIII